MCREKNNARRKADESSERAIEKMGTVIRASSAQQAARALLTAQQCAHNHASARQSEKCNCDRMAFATPIDGVAGACDATTRPKSSKRRKKNDVSDLLFFLVALVGRQRDELLFLLGLLLPLARRHYAGRMIWGLRGAKGELVGARLSGARGQARDRRRATE